MGGVLFWGLFSDLHVDSVIASSINVGLIGEKVIRATKYAVLIGNAERSSLMRNICTYDN